MEWLPLLFSGVSNIFSGISGANDAREAARIQSRSIRDAMDFQRGNLRRVVGLTDRTARESARGIADATGRSIRGLTPWMESGRKALDAYMGELGLGGSGFKSAFRKTPGYDFQVKEGEKAAVGNLRALGLGGSGAALKALTRYRQGVADQTYGQYVDRLGGMQQQGQGAATDIANLRTNGANSIANIRMSGANNIADAYVNGGNSIADNMVNLGQVQAGGQVGGGNAWRSALSGFTGDMSRALGGYNRGWNFLGAR
jgi:hypothetical protein